MTTRLLLLLLPPPGATGRRGDRHSSCCCHWLTLLLLCLIRTGILPIAVPVAHTLMLMLCMLGVLKLRLLRLVHQVADLGTHRAGMRGGVRDISWPATL